MVPTFFSRVNFIIEHDGDIEKNYSHVWEGITYISHIYKGGGAGYILNKIHTLTNTYTYTHTYTHSHSPREECLVLSST